MNNEFQLYDKINTTAANWLRIYRNTINKNLGIKNFKNNKLNLWVLKIIELVSISKGYENFFISGNILTWFKLRYLKHFKHLKFSLRPNKEKIDFINVDIFIKEICLSCEIEPKILEDMFNEYW